jgi:hydroxylamine dehydrogenase
MDSRASTKFTFTFVLIILAASALQAQTTIPARMSEQTEKCIGCHRDATHGIYQEWGTSKHFRANVGCYECHQAQPGDKDAMKHDDFLISIIVSPKDCGRCHSSEVAQFEDSHHAKAAFILGSLDNFLADIVEGDWNYQGGSALTVNGCAQCHGNEVKVGKDGSLLSTGWPNTGIGRINPDASVGSCSACHQRHAFSAAQARQPENCGKCHLGPDHPQKEIYDESKHGIAYAAHKDDLSMDEAKWVLGEDYTAAPTCATCHMSSVRTSDGDLLPVTHDVGLRISWNNRPAVSIRPEISDKKLGLEKMAAVTWDKRRAEMQQVCHVCHTPGFTGNFYEQYDGLIQLYDSKFAEPGVKLMGILTQNKLITDTQFDEPVEWTWYELWHHEGRRARHGASMMAPDYTHWHGMYEVGKHFYMEFIPELKEIAAANLNSPEAGKAVGAKALNAALTELLARPEHAWSTGNLSPEEKAKRAKDQKEFIERYKK